MAKSSSMYIRIDPEVKANVEAIYSQYGMSITDAINVFLYTSINIGGLPFDLRPSIPNAERKILKVFQRLFSKQQCLEEIDILAYHQKQAIFGECKWRNEDTPLSIYQSLLERSNIFSFEECYYYIFSKSGFTESCQEAARSDENLNLVSLSEICSEIAGTK